MAANVQQTSSKRPAIHVYFEYICWKFAGRLLDRVNTLRAAINVNRVQQLYTQPVLRLQCNRRVPFTVTYLLTRCTPV